MGVPATGLPLALNCVRIVAGRDSRDTGTADLGLVGWDWENLCSDLGACTWLLLKMVSSRELWDRFFCMAREG
jgi:hypothetical protein